MTCQTGSLRRASAWLLAASACSAIAVTAQDPRPGATSRPAEDRAARSASEPARELRGAWIDRSSLVSRDEIRKTMKTLADGRFNVAFVLVWSRGYPLWRSRVFERETGLVTDPDYGGRDVLREAIEEAGAAGIHLMPWVEYGFVAGYTPHHPGKNGCGPIFDRHPDWLAKTKSGETRFPAPGGQYCWLAHARPDAQEFLLALMAELAREYKTAGVQFDRARYPQFDCGYDDYTREAYRRERGVYPPDDPAEQAWVRWRADGLNAFVKTLYARLKTADPAGLVSNAPIAYPYGYDNFAQDYPGWMRDRSVDFMVPQLYRKDLASFERDLDIQLAGVVQPALIVPGIDITNTSADVVIASIEAARRRNLPGVVIWYYRGLERAGAFERLSATVFRKRASLPW